MVTVRRAPRHETPGHRADVRGKISLGDYVLFKAFDVVHSHVVLAGMVAGGAFYRGFGAGVFVAAYEALPHNGAVAFPHGSFLNLTEIVDEAAAVVLLDFGYGEEVVGDVVEAFVARHLGGIAVELGALYEFFVGGGLEVLLGGAYYTGVDAEGDGNIAALKEFKEHLAVAQLVGGGLGEDACYGEVVLLLSLGGIICISTVGCRFCHVGNDEIFLGFGALDTCSGHKRGVYRVSYRYYNAWDTLFVQPKERPPLLTKRRSHQLNNL